jgi:hypothetical protein
MIKKECFFEWKKMEKDSFNQIKSVISNDSILKSPYFHSDFFLYTFASDLSLATILTQKYDEGN